MAPPTILLPGDVLWRVRHAIRWRWQKLRGLTGEFDVPENSGRCHAMTEAWQRNWSEADPIGHRLRGPYCERWVRFHSLPESKRYADSPEEYAEIIRRHRTVLAELPGENAPEHLVVIAEDWGPRDLATGWSKTHVPGAWPWRRVEGDEPDLGLCYLWVRTGLTDSQLNVLLTAVADDKAHVVLAAPDLSWLFCPYDGGADVILPDVPTRDAIRDRHTDWLPALPSGL
ncbi:hypothetical protein ACIBL3_04475 [Kribbella sp. NPDC050124]|uniref:DUF3885 domain-containing protein n=1 Tax=Kribbella sp. NPDC050124 TaxID=3364114 RepID=UPI0037B33AAC